MEGLVRVGSGGLIEDDAIRAMLFARLDDARRLAIHILRDVTLAEDAVQEAACLAWARRGGLRDRASVDGWFTRILVNVCRDELRRQARRPRLVALDPELDDPPSRGGGVGAPESDLGAAIRRLNPDEQVLVALRFGQERTVPEIAVLLGVPEGTVKSRLHACLRHLRAALDAERRAGENLR